MHNKTAFVLAPVLSTETAPTLSWLIGELAQIGYGMTHFSRAADLITHVAERAAADAIVLFRPEAPGDIGKSIAAALPPGGRRPRVLLVGGACHGSESELHSLGVVRLTGLPQAIAVLRGTKKIGVDIGRVIIDEKTCEHGLAVFDGDPAPYVHGAIVGLQKLLQVFCGELFIISKAGEEAEKRCREWFAQQHFFRTTGVRPDALYFCRERAEKAGICHALGITDFVDDKLEVLGSMEGIVPRRYLFRPKQDEVERHARHLGGVTVLSDWRSALLAIR